MMDSNKSQSLQKVSFSDKVTVIDPDKGLRLYTDDLQQLFYSNSDVHALLEECKASEELPVFWYSLRLERLKLLYHQVATVQFRL